MTPPRVTYLGGQSRKRVFIVSPLRARAGRSQAGNEALAERLSLEAVNMGAAPFPPHLLYTRFLDDALLDERQAGMECGRAWLEVAEQVWVYARDGISEGMAKEIALANGLGIPVVTPRGWEEEGV